MDLEYTSGVTQRGGSEGGRRGNLHVLHPIQILPFYLHPMNKCARGCNIQKKKNERYNKKIKYVLVNSHMSYASIYILNAFSKYYIFSMQSNSLSGWSTCESTRCCMLSEAGMFLQDIVRRVTRQEFLKTLGNLLFFFNGCYNCKMYHFLNKLYSF